MGDKPKKLYRSHADKMLGGVCAGIAHYCNIDPTIMRLIYVMITLITGGIGVLFYLLMWVITPVEPCVSERGGRVIDHE